MTDWVLNGIAGERWLIAVAVLAVWIIASVYWLWPARKTIGESAEILVAHASQTGTAEHLAGLMKKQLDGHGRDAALVSLGNLPKEQLLTAKRLLVVAATTGTGEAPDQARHIERQLMVQELTLPHLEIFILALGDRSYADFCAFGFRLKDWAQDAGARVALVTVDNQSTDDLVRWDDLMQANDLPPISETRTQAIQDWTVDTRDIVAQGDTKPIQDSRAGSLFHIRLSPLNGSMPRYEVGDLFEWYGDDGVRREFSIASLPDDPSLDLFVRRVELPGGAMGKASATLTGSDGPSQIKGQIRPFPNFHETAGTGPLLAIAAGSGWGGLRPHVVGAIQKGRPVWLIYGERGPDRDLAIFSEMLAWHKEGRIQKLDLTLSRADTPAPRYVQDCVAQSAEGIVDFLGNEGAVAICGAAAMGDQVVEQLKQALPDQWIEDAYSKGRFRSATY
ncbi:MAG: NADPH cytochrome P450 oxidoreductase family protein [Pseudomonadota bacterium]